MAEFHGERQAGFGLHFEMNRRRDLAFAQPAIGGAALHAGYAPNAVEPGVGKSQRPIRPILGPILGPALGPALGKDMAASLSLLSPHFEDVGEIGVEFEFQLQVDRLLPVVLQRDAVIAGGFGKDLGAVDVKRAPRQRLTAGQPEIGIGEIGGEEQVVFADR